MRIDKTLELAKITADATYFYYGNTHVASVYIPLVIHDELYRIISEDMDIYVLDLEGYQTDYLCDVNIEATTIEREVKKELDIFGGSENIQDSIFVTIADLLELTDSEMEELVEFNREIWQLSNDYHTSNVSMILQEDGELEGFIIPKGTKIEIRTRKDDILDNWNLKAKYLEEIYYEELL